MKKKLFVVILLIALAAVYFAWQAYNKPVASLHDVKAETEITAEQLFADFASDEDKANQNYLGKVIQVTGKILDVNLNANEFSTVYLDANDVMGSVSCQLEKGEEIRAENFITGQEISIKGKCTGFAMDVVLTQCIIKP